MTLEIGSRRRRFCPRLQAPRFIGDIIFTIPYRFISRIVMLSLSSRRAWFVVAGVAMSHLSTARTSFAAVVTDPALPQQMDFGPRAPLSTIALSKDGKTLASVATDGEIRWRDVQSGKTLIKTTISRSTGWIMLLSDGSFLSRGQDTTISWWEAPKTGQPLKLKREISAPKPLLEYSQATIEAVKAKNWTYIEPAKLWVSQTTVSPDGKILAVIYRENLPPWISDPEQKTARVVLLNMSNGDVLRELAPISYTQTMPVVGFADGGKTLLVARPDHSVQWQDVVTGKQLKSWQPPETAAQSPNDGAEEEARRFEKLPPHIRDAIRRSPNRREKMIEGPEKKFGTPILFSPDGKLLLSFTLGGSKLWDLTTSTARVFEKSGRSAVGTPVFSPDSSRIAFHSSNGFAVWDTSGKQRGLATAQFTEFSDFAFAPDNSTVAMSDNLGQVRMWNVAEATGPKILKVLPGFVSALRSVHTLKDGVLSVTNSHLLRIPTTGKPQWFTVPLMKTSEPIPANTRQFLATISVSPDGTLLAEAVALSPFYSSLEAKGFVRGEVRVRDAKTGVVLWRIADADRYRSPLLAWLPDNSLLTGKDAPSVRLHGSPDDGEVQGLQRRDGRTGEYKDIEVEWGRKRGSSEPGSIEELETSENALSFAVNSGYVMQIIDLKAGKVLRGIDQIMPDEYSFALSPDGRWLVGGHREGGVYLWDSSIKDENHYSKADIVLLPRSKDGIRVSAVAFGKDESLVVGLSDGRVLLWQQPFTKEAAPMWETAANGASIRALNFDADGNLWIGDARGELHTRNAKTGELQSVLRLTPPTSTTQEALPGWVRWNRNGSITKSP